MAQLPSAQPAYWPNVYSCAVTRSATTGVLGDRFGFNATALRLLNTEAVDIYVSLTSTTISTTSAFRVRACSEVWLSGLAQTAGFCVFGTSTGATGVVLNMTAFGGSAG